MSVAKGKVVAISGDKNFVKIGNDLASSVWYGKGQTDVSTLTKGSEVEVEFGVDSTGKRAITKVLGSAPSASAPSNSYTPKTFGNNNFKKPYSGNFQKQTYGKSAEEQESIKCQAIGHMVSRSLMAFSGQLDANNLSVAEAIVEKLYTKYYEIIQKHIDSKKSS